MCDLLILYSFEIFFSNIEGSCCHDLLLYLYNYCSWRRLSIIISMTHIDCKVIALLKKIWIFFPFYQFFHIIMFWCYVCSMKYWTFLLLRNQFTVNCVLWVNKKIVMRKLSHFLLLLLFFIKYFNIYEQNNLKSPIYIDKY